MKPVSPEERELEALAAEVCARYRDADQAQPSARLDAAILDAARLQARRPKKRNWHLPASIAAMLVIGVSLALMTSEIEDPLPPLDPGAGGRAGDAASEAGAAPPGSQRRAEPAAQAQPDRAQAQFGADVGGRLSRERTARELAAAEDRAPAPVSRERNADVVPPVSPEAPAAIQAPPPSGAGALREREPLADVGVQPQSAATAKSKPESTAVGPGNGPADWLGRIEALLQKGRNAEAEQELARFRRQYPDYPLPQRLREWSDRLKR